MLVKFSWHAGRRFVSREDTLWICQFWIFSRRESIVRLGNTYRPRRIEALGAERANWGELPKRRLRARGAMLLDCDQEIITRAMKIEAKSFPY